MLKERLYLFLNRTPWGGSGVFIRGDVDQDGQLTIGDAILGLNQLFGGQAMPCADASDVNDSGGVDIADPVYLLSFLFVEGKAPPEPYPDEGLDPTPDSLGCRS